MAFRICKAAPVPDYKRSPRVNWWGVCVVYDGALVPDAVVTEAMERHATSIMRAPKRCPQSAISRRYLRDCVRAVAHHIHKATGHHAIVDTVLI